MAQLHFAGQPGETGARDARPEFGPLVYRMVCAIPPGRVMTYGGVAAELGAPRHAREVGWVLARCSSSEVPCHRVILASGRPSPGFAHGQPERQRAMLEAEGVEFRPDGSLDLRRYLWWPPTDGTCNLLQSMWRL
jgi:methylated-DNA-protein-cysteine methyltransferase related protein